MNKKKKLQDKEISTLSTAYDKISVLSNFQPIMFISCKGKNKKKKKMFLFLLKKKKKKKKLPHLKKNNHLYGLKNDIFSQNKVGFWQCMQIYLYSICSYTCYNNNCFYLKFNAKLHSWSNTIFE